MHWKISKSILRVRSGVHTGANLSDCKICQEQVLAHSRQGFITPTDYQRAMKGCCQNACGRPEVTCERLYGS
jgi:hypothetical protein